MSEEGEAEHDDKSRVLGAGLSNPHLTEPPLEAKKSRMIRGFFVLLVFQLAGEVLEFVRGLYCRRNRRVDNCRQHEPKNRAAGGIGASSQSPAVRFGDRTTSIPRSSHHAIEPAVVHVHAPPTLQSSAASYRSP
jgi:hypothetical protein